jgi:hypothetical protein
MVAAQPWSQESHSQRAPSDFLHHLQIHFQVHYQDQIHFQDHLQIHLRLLLHLPLVAAKEPFQTLPLSVGIPIDGWLAPSLVLSYLKWHPKLEPYLLLEEAQWPFLQH